MPRFFKTMFTSEANLKVYVTNIRSEADVIVYETKNQWDATENPVWFYTALKCEADKRVYFTDNKAEADLIIFKTDVKSEAEWINNEKVNKLRWNA